MKCEYNCNNEAKHILSNGKHCCNLSYNKCPSIRKKNSDGLKLAYKENRKNNNHLKGKQHWAKGKTAQSDSRIKSSTTPRSETLRRWVEDIYGYLCSKCKLSEWNNESLRLEVDHIDGDRFNNKIENLRFLCPNCHSQTETWRGRNINSGKTKVSNAILIEALKNHSSIAKALKFVGLAPKGGNYTRCYTLLNENNF